MRISDWSSDVCSSDLLHLVAEGAVVGGHHREGDEAGAGDGDRIAAGVHAGDVQAAGAQRLELRGVRLHRKEGDFLAGHLGQVRDEAVRSEEHTSELQSLMRISYAVFCLKKKKTKTLFNDTH